MTNCDIQIWHTLAEVKIFVFLFVIKLFLNCCCSINVLYCFANFFSFAICSLCIKIFICCRVCRRDRYWDNRHIRVTAFEVKAACMGILISRELPYE